MSDINFPMEWPRFVVLQTGAAPLSQAERADGWHLCPDRGGLLLNTNEKDCACQGELRG